MVAIMLYIICDRPIWLVPKIEYLNISKSVDKGFKLTSHRIFSGTISKE
jgi:hypothetical protein